MLVDYRSLSAGDPAIAATLAAARSARNLLSRQRREEAADGRDETARRRRKKLSDREADTALAHRVRVRVEENSRPRCAGTPRKLVNRTPAGLLAGSYGTSSSRGPDGLHSIHYQFTARSFASTTGRQWKAGEAERAARYIMRDDALEALDAIVSNISVDQNEIAAFFRTVEKLEQHDRKNANVYCSEIIALPAELTEEGRLRAVGEICSALDKRQLMHVAALHKPDRSGDQRNFHVHILYSTRPAVKNQEYDWSFSLSKDLSINCKDGIISRRQFVVECINRELERECIDKRYTPLSNRARRMPEPVRPKVGQAETWASRKRKSTEMRFQMVANLSLITTDLIERIDVAGDRLRNAQQVMQRRLGTAWLRLIDCVPTVQFELDHTAEQVKRHLVRTVENVSVTRGKTKVGLGKAQTDVEAELRRAIVDRAGSAAIASKKLQATADQMVAGLNKHLSATVRSNRLHALELNKLRSERAANLASLLPETRPNPLDQQSAIADDTSGGQMPNFASSTGRSKAAVARLQELGARQIEAGQPSRRERTPELEVAVKAPRETALQQAPEDATAARHQLWQSEIERLELQACARRNAEGRTTAPSSTAVTGMSAAEQASLEQFDQVAKRLNATPTAIDMSEQTAVAPPSKPAEKFSASSSKEIDVVDYYDEYRKSCSDPGYHYEQALPLRTLGGIQGLGGQHGFAGMRGLQAQLLGGRSKGPAGGVQVPQHGDIRRGEEDFRVREVRVVGDARRGTLLTQVAELSSAAANNIASGQTPDLKPRSLSAFGGGLAKGPAKTDSPLIDPKSKGRGR